MCPLPTWSLRQGYFPCFLLRPPLQSGRPALGPALATGLGQDIPAASFWLLRSFLCSHLRLCDRRQPTKTHVQTQSGPAVASDRCRRASRFCTTRSAFTAKLFVAAQLQRHTRRCGSHAAATASRRLQCRPRKRLSPSSRSLSGQRLGHMPEARGIDGKRPFL